MNARRHDPWSGGAAIAPSVPVEAPGRPSTGEQGPDVADAPERLPADVADDLTADELAAWCAAGHGRAVHLLAALDALAA